MNLRTWIAAPVLAATLVACGQETQTGNNEIITDIAAALPDNVSIVFENDHVRILRLVLEPAEELPLHEGRPRVIYSLSDYALDWQEGGEELGRREWREGDVHVHGEGVHSARNSGEAPARFIVFERLDSPLPSAPSEEHASQLPVGARALLEDDDFAVLEVELQPGEAQEPHPGRWRAIYSLTDYTIEWREGDRVETRAWRAGDAHWHAPAAHSASNTGETPARWIVVGLKN